MYNFGLSKEQIEFKATLRKYLDGECALANVRKTIETSDRFASRQWKELASLGLIGAGVPEVYGGSGLGETHLAAAMEELGRTSVPAPLIETMLVASLIQHIGSDAQKSRYLGAICAGDCVATLAIDEPDGYWVADAVQASATPDAHGGFVLAGVKLCVPFAHVADLVVCAVRTTPASASGVGISLVAIEREKLAGRIQLLGSIDDTYPLCELALDGLTVTASAVVGPLHEGWSAWLGARRLGNVLASAQLVGGMERGLEMLVSFSRDRVQFGKPIGSYQAVKHRCADMLTDLEAVRGSVYYAAWAIQEQAEDAEFAVSSGKAFAADAAVRSAEKALQSFGAIAFTWEHDIHFFLKRAKRLESTWGDASFHREQIAALSF